LKKSFNKDYYFGDSFTVQKDKTVIFDIPLGDILGIKGIDLFTFVVIGWIGVILATYHFFRLNLIC
jgi:hypothetical protein